MEASTMNLRDNVNIMIRVHKRRGSRRLHNECEHLVLIAMLVPRVGRFWRSPDPNLDPTAEKLHYATFDPITRFITRIDIFNINL